MQTYKNQCPIDNFDIIGSAYHPFPGHIAEQHLPNFPLLALEKRLHIKISDKSENECLQY